MKCEKCGKNEAVFFYQETVNGQTRQAHLCADCAREAGTAESSIFASVEPFFTNPFGGVSTFWSNSMGLPVAGRLPRERKCQICGTTESELRRTGRTGCSACYQTFAEVLLPYLRQIHGADTHCGCAHAVNSASAQDTKNVLLERQRQAIAQENYEEAARLRDELRKLEGDGQ